MWESCKYARKSSTQQQQEEKRATLNGTRLKVMTLKHTLNTHTLTLALISSENLLIQYLCYDLGTFNNHCLIRIGCSCCFCFFCTVLFIFREYRQLVSYYDK